MRTFIVYIFMFLMSLLLFSCGEYYSKYKITGVELKHINMIDSTSHNKEYYLLSFNVEWCEPEIRFFTGPGVEPGLNGIKYEIHNIEILNEQNDIITKEFKGWNLQQMCTLIKGDNCYDFYSLQTISELIDSINSNSNLVRGKNIEIPILFYLQSSSIPRAIVVNAENAEIRSTVIEDMELSYAKKDCL